MKQTDENGKPVICIGGLNKQSESAVEWLVETIQKQIDAGYGFTPKYEEGIIEEAKKMEISLRNNIPIHIHEGISNTFVYIEDGVVHIKPNNLEEIILCGTFIADTKTSSATRCICGREKWEHSTKK